MARFLVACSTKRGQTLKISEFIGKELRHLGHEAEVRCLDSLLARKSVDGFDGVVVGAPVYRGGFPRGICEWLWTNSAGLKNKPGAFFSVCLSVLDNDPETQLKERKSMSDFCGSADWRPLMREIFAGSLRYTQYNLPVRWMMKRIAAKNGGDTDTSRDYEYTDWEQVRRFARDFESLATSFRIRKAG